MQFKLATDYAVRILCELSTTKKLCTATELSEKIGISYLYFMKVITRLKAEGLVESVQGCNGGYLLVKDPEKITMYDVVCVMEGELQINRCLEEDQYCSRNATANCTVHKCYKSLQEMIIQQLKTKNIADLSRTEILEFKKA